MAEDKRDAPTSGESLVRARFANFLAATAHCGSASGEDAIFALVGALSIEVARHPQPDMMLNMVMLSVLDMRPLVMAAAERMTAERVAREVDQIIRRPTS